MDPNTESSSQNVKVWDQAVSPEVAAHTGRSGEEPVDATFCRGKINPVPQIQDSKSARFIKLTEVYYICQVIEPACWSQSPEQGTWGFYHLLQAKRKVSVSAPGPFEIYSAYV